MKCFVVWVNIEERVWEDEVIYNKNILHVFMDEEKARKFAKQYDIDWKREHEGQHGWHYGYCEIEEIDYTE